MRILLRTHATDEFWDRTAHGLVDLDAKLAKLIASRHRAFLKTKATDTDLVEAHYADSSVTYFDDLVPEDVLDDGRVEKLWDQGWVELPSRVSLARFTQARTESEYLVIGANYFHWVCSPKHGNVEVITETLWLDAFQAVNRSR